MKDHKTVAEMTRLVREVRDEFADPDHDIDPHKILILTAIHDALLWVITTTVPNTRITGYFPDPDN